MLAWVTALKYHHELHAHARLGDGVKIPRRARERNPLPPLVALVADWVTSLKYLPFVWVTDVKIPSMRLGD